MLGLAVQVDPRDHGEREHAAEAGEGGTARPLEDARQRGRRALQAADDVERTAPEKSYSGSRSSSSGS
jgi:hypothetical protein